MYERADVRGTEPYAVQSLLEGIVLSPCLGMTPGASETSCTHWRGLSREAHFEPQAVWHREAPYLTPRPSVSRPQTLRVSIHGLLRLEGGGGVGLHLSVCGMRGCMAGIIWFPLSSPKRSSDGNRLHGHPFVWAAARPFWGNKRGAPCVRLPEIFRAIRWLTLRGPESRSRRGSPWGCRARRRRNGRAWRRSTWRRPR